MTQYWVIRGGERRGPYEESDILEGVELGTVRPNDLLWVEGMRQGVPIDEVISNLGAAPPSRPPLMLEPRAARAASPYRPPAARVDDLAELALGNITYAGFWVRFAAALLDSLLVAAVLALVLWGVSLLTGLRLLQNDLWVNLGALVAGWLYFAALESGPRCAGYGKRAFNLQVLAADGLTRIGFLRASGRWLGRYLSTILLFLGYAIQPFTPRKRALHDFLSGTVVVVQRSYSRGLLAVVLILVLLPLILLVVGIVLGAGARLASMLGR